ncbi:DUF502 domain-containing protein [Halorientalis pallida]|uniref:DUF502 domain-containing protein n=1 Tax=Halorientalis pallida TaxID=2479928 RepID=A0A498KQ83_9EURY|nr:DUF502 domain-containing protein [Halorientalis pallida]RXK46257.1 DUF502 domain-containing protein [Halorientalis pallida]
MRFTQVLRNSFVAGLALLAPLVVTVVAMQFLVGWVTTLIDPVVQGTRLTQYTANIEAIAQALALLVIVGVIVVLGYLAQGRIGQRLFGWIDRGIGVVPLVSIIYSSVRQVADALMERSNRYRSVVMIEYPREGVYSLGFVTGDGPVEAEAVAGEDVYNVFLPNSPNPTGGHFLMVPRDEVHELDMSVRRGVRLLVTTGIAESAEEMAELRAEADLPQYSS